MRAIVWYGGSDLRIEDIPKPKLRNERHVVLRVKFCGICGSELQAYKGCSTRRVPPLVMGHEFSGEVVETGSDVKEIEIGDRVAVNPIISCGRCLACLRGRQNLCLDMKLIGMHMPGAFAEYVSVPAENCVKLPSEVDFEEGALAEPLANALHAVNRARPSIGDSVAILGPGPIGLSIMLLVQTIGVESVTVIGRSEDRLKIAEKFGANEVISIKNEKELMRIGEEVFDMVFEAAGSWQAVKTAIKFVKKGGRIIIVGLSHLKPMEDIGLMSITTKELDVLGSYGYTAFEFQKAVRLLSRLPMKEMITHIFPLSRAKDAFELLSQRKEPVLKVLLELDNGL
ncbi:MAG: hypothetical protein DRO40_08525 [Thermoprotei archaeon]|nr:MAG: hypothetical protein DRO40_08525 [Thermoprotei archaeon]